MATLDLAAPEAHEVLVELGATGVCHTDYCRYTGEVEAPYPIVLGHEGAGRVVSTGEDVTSVAESDHVVLFAMPSCGSCEFCASGRPVLCETGTRAAFSGTMLDGTRRLAAGDEPVSHFFAQSSFATHAVVPEGSVVTIPDDVPFPEAALLGCGASTGLGAVLNTADVSAGESVAVFGCGGVGASAIMAASAVSAGPIVAVDVVPEKLSAAEGMGATHTIDASDEDPVSKIRALGGVDYAIECAGRTETAEQALAGTKRGGTTVVVGEITDDEAISVPPTAMLPYAKRLEGSLLGSTRPSVDIPRFARLHRNGDIDLSALLADRYALSELEDALAAMERGDSLRGVLTFGE